MTTSSSYAKRGIALVGALGVTSILVFAGAFLYMRSYDGRVYPGVFVGEYTLAGLDASQITSFIENANNRYAKEGIALEVVNTTDPTNKAVVPTVTGGENAVELISLDSESFVKQALVVGREGGFWSRLIQPLSLRFLHSQKLRVPVIMATDLFESQIKTALESFEDQPQNAVLVFAPGTVPQPTVVAERTGKSFDYHTIRSRAEMLVSEVSFMPIPVSLTDFRPTVVGADIQSLLPRINELLREKTITLAYTDSATKQATQWVLAPKDLARFTEVRRAENGEAIVGLSEGKVSEYLVSTVGAVVNREAQEAKFAVKEGKVHEFQASLPGQKVSTSTMFAQLEERFLDTSLPSSTLAVAVEAVSPKLTTAELNDFGITQIIGAGSSTFKNSPTNRIKNLALAVKKLNGVLIAPGEEFSTNKFAGPYTLENGYLPEQVIKGNKITPEVGGGMCQIGTTLFRMAMNTGLPITERHNHSLVVSYYADPVNGNPGTDATLYEPLLDLKFKNDTESYILLQTEMDMKTQILTFTLWGKPDGRKGSFTHPVVSKWIPAGEPQEIIVTDGSLKPGQQKCQNAFRGAVASFTYTRVTPTGEKIDRVFDSYYRPLQKICMVGAELPSETVADPVGSSEQPAAPELNNITGGTTTQQ